MCTWVFFVPKYIYFMKNIDADNDCMFILYMCIYIYMYYILIRPFIYRPKMLSSYHIKHPSFITPSPLPKLEALSVFSLCLGTVIIAKVFLGRSAPVCPMNPICQVNYPEANSVFRPRKCLERDASPSYNGMY